MNFNQFKSEDQFDQFILSETDLYGILAVLVAIVACLLLLATFPGSVHIFKPGHLEHQGVHWKRKRSAKKLINYS